MIDSNTITIPDNDTDRKLLYKKGFKSGKNCLIVPDKYTCIYYSNHTTIRIDGM